jgi:anti-sigma factor RsiW
MLMYVQLGCEDVTQGLTEYLDEALPPGRRDRYERHLAHCAHCARHLHELRQIIHRLGALPHEPMPAPMKERLLHAHQSRQSA